MTAIEHAARPAQSLFNRPDTILGICQGVADDLGISAMWLRVPFGAAFYWHMTGVTAAYLVLGIILLLARWLVPAQATVAAAAAPIASQPREQEDHAALQLAA